MEKQLTDGHASEPRWPGRRLLPAWAFLLLYAVATLGVTVGIVQMELQRDMLYIFAVPTLVAAVFYTRTVYLLALALLVGASFAIAAAQTTLTPELVIYTAISLGAGIGGSELVHSLVKNYRATLVALSRERDFVRSIVVNQGEGIGIVSAEDESFTYANPAAWRIFGVAAGELQGRRLSEFTTAASYRKVLNETSKRQQGETSNYELEIVRPSGEHRCLLVTAVPRTDEEGTLTGTLGIFVDITERKAMASRQARRAAQLALLNDVGREITGELELTKLQQRTVDLVQATFNFDHVGILVVDATAGVVRMVARSGYFSDIYASDHCIRLDQGLVGWACRHGESVVSNDVHQDERYVNHYPDKIATQSELAVPIWVSGEVVGVLDVQSIQRDAFDADALVVLETLADQLAVAMGNAQLYEALQDQLAERKKAEVALRESEERLALALEGGDLGAWDWSVRTGTVAYSRRWATMLGYELEDIAPQLSTWESLIHPEDRSGAMRQLTSGWAQTADPTSDNVHLSLELRMRASDGTWRWILIRGRVTERDAGGSAARVAGTTMDITARKRAEIALRDLNASLEAQVAARTNELERERDKSRAILQTTGDAIALVDAHLEINYVNPAFEAATGYQAHESIGRRIPELIGHPGVKPETAAGMRHTIDSNIPWNGETTMRRKDGRLYDALLQIAPVRDAQGNVTSYLTSHRDISRLKALQRMQTRFIANVSHELRTPIAILKLYLEMLPDAAPDKRTEYEAALRQETEHLARLVENILRINTLSGDGLRISPQPAQLNDLIQTYVLPSCSALGGPERPSLELDLSPEDPTAQVDQTWLVEALCHLVDNAVRFTPPSGTVTITTRYQERQDKQWATIEVIDTGIGIPPEEQAQIFDHFFRGQTTDSEQISGTGLGLSITQAVAELHGGAITVQSMVEEGSTFTVWLPPVE